ncbi:MAG: hypothetical protein AAGC46_19985, partial [Solirubrobacteraceae bacterium]
VVPVVTPAPTPAPITPTPVPVPVPTPSPLTVSLTKPPSSVRAGATLTLHLHVTRGSGTVAVKLSHGKTTLAKTTAKTVSGAKTVKLRVPRSAKTGKATLTVQIGTAKPVTKTITVGRHA